MTDFVAHRTIDQFEKSLLQGRASVSGGYLVLFGLQALVLLVLVIQPLVEIILA